MLLCSGWCGLLPKLHPVLQQWLRRGQNLEPAVKFHLCCRSFWVTTACPECRSSLFGALLCTQMEGAAYTMLIHEMMVNLGTIVR
jgi:hypothetical protein